MHDVAGPAASGRPPVGVHCGCTAVQADLPGRHSIQLHIECRPRGSADHAGTAEQAGLPGNLSFSFREMRAAVPAPKECPVTTSPYPLASRALSILAPTPWPVSSSLHRTGRAWHRQRLQEYGYDCSTATSARGTQLPLLSAVVLLLQAACCRSAASGGRPSFHDAGLPLARVASEQAVQCSCAHLWLL